MKNRGFQIVLICQRRLGHIHSFPNFSNSLISESMAWANDDSLKKTKDIDFVSIEQSEVQRTA